MSIIAANFKSNHTRKTTKDFFSKLNTYVKATKYKEDIFVFPSSSSFIDSNNLEENIIQGTQNAYPANKGAFTGEISSSHLDEFDIKTIILGHSERRYVLNESQDFIADKFKFYQDLGYKIIYCVGESLELRNEGFKSSLEYIWELFDKIDISYSKLILAYEPIWAIGTGKSASQNDIIQMHECIKAKIHKPLLYGGSVNAKNARSICSLANVDGALVGSASLDFESFKQILENTKDL